MNAQTLMGYLGPFKGRSDLLVEDQSTGDIIEAILQAHKDHIKEYAKISSFFKGGSKRQIGKRIYDFLKKNVAYRIEPSDRQTTASPASIMALGKGDCKHYSLWTGGILQNLGIPFAFRFASYRIFDPQPQHVFCVIDPGTDHEIWIDPVLSKFDEKKPYYYSTDRKTMAIYKISGIGATAQQKAALKAAKQQKKGAQTKAEKKAATTQVKAARQAAGRTTKQVLQKGAKAVLKVAAAPVRNSFLLLVSINFANLAVKLSKAWDKAPSKVRTFWEGSGGMLESLKKAWEKGQTKKRIFGSEESYIGFAPAAAAASAAPLLVKVSDFLKSVGIDPAELVEIGKKALNEKAQELAKKALEPKAAELATDIDVSDQVIDTEPMSVTSTPVFDKTATTATPKMNYLPFLIGGAAVIYLVTRKK